MSTNLVIVAIPEEQDRVWKLSSEKVPHLTLLFLGEEEGADTQQIMQFVEHAATLSEHGPFYLDVDHRGELGEEQADVLFFSKRSWNLKWIKQFRGQLLQNQAVRTAYDSAEQFGEWLPHLTLGYPETPAKEPEDGNDYPLYSVAFDRIAVWTGNYEGPEFRLEWPDRPEEFDGPLAVAWADEQKRALMHYGVKGWEHRKAEDGTGSPTTTNTKIKEDLEGSLTQSVEHGEIFVDGLVHGAMGAAELGEAFILEHYGVKGMRWGVRSAGTVGLAGGSAPGGFRRAAPTPVAPKANSKVPHGKKRKTKVVTDGGENLPAAKDAIKVAEAQAKLRRSGPKSLSNQELREVAERVRLEQQAVQATRSGPNRFIRKLLGDEGKQIVTDVVRDNVTRKNKGDGDKNKGGDKK